MTDNATCHDICKGPPCQHPEPITWHLQPKRSKEAREHVIKHLNRQPHSHGERE